MAKTGIDLQENTWLSLICFVKGYSYGSAPVPGAKPGPKPGPKPLLSLGPSRAQARFFHVPQWLRGRGAIHAPEQMRHGHMKHKQQLPSFCLVEVQHLGVPSRDERVIAARASILDLKAEAIRRDAKGMIFKSDEELM